MSWFRRRRTSDAPELPPLPDAPRVADLPKARLEAVARYLGTTSAGDPVTAQELGGQGAARLLLSEEALDVVRIGAPFRIQVAALRGARHVDDGFCVSWQHGDHLLESTFRLSDKGSMQPIAERQNVWVRKLSKLARKGQTG